MNAIVTIINDTPVTTSLAIAEGTENDHASVIKLVRAYQSDLEEFGLLDFKSESTGGRPTEYAILNEQQSTLILTYMRNSEIVRAFKKRLVKSFYELAHGAKQDKTKPKEIAETSKAMLSMAKAFGFKGNQALLSADRATQKLINVSPLSLLGAELISENKNKLLTPSDIGEQLGLTARVVNQMLQDLGLQKSYRDAKGNLYWDLTENGTQYAELVDTVKRHGNGAPIKQIKWQSAIVDTLKSRV